MKSKQVLLIASLFFGLHAFGQFGVAVGTSMMRPFGAQKTFAGFHVGGEYSQDDEMSYFGRVTHHFGVTDPVVVPVVLQALSSSSPFAETRYRSKTNYTMLSGGARYYLGDGYEMGFSAYGGSLISLVFNSVKADFEEYDEENYMLPDGFNAKGNAFGFGIGLQGGVKYGILNFATVYFDVDLNYLIAYQASNSIAQNSRYLSNILFQFSLGFRRDIYWRN